MNDRKVPATGQALNSHNGICQTLKKRAIHHYSDLAFTRRKALIPDYKLQNAGLGIYDADLASTYQVTVKAFRDEFYRIKAEIEKAKTVEAVEAVKANYPEAIISGSVTRVDKKQEVMMQEVKKATTKEPKTPSSKKATKAAKKKTTR